MQEKPYGNTKILLDQCNTTIPIPSRSDNPFAASSGPAFQTDPASVFVMILILVIVLLAGAALVALLINPLKQVLP